MNMADVLVERPAFEGFPKIVRLSREIVITEKLDGTNAQIVITDEGEIELFPGRSATAYVISAGSKNRWLTTEDDNFGFAAWVKKHQEELVRDLGVGRHFGEWWGKGIQRGYGLDERRFSLFNTASWQMAGCPLENEKQQYAPACCHVVPILWRGPFDTEQVAMALNRLEVFGSEAAPGFRDPEGVVVFHTAANMMFKKTIANDESPKGKK